MFNRPSTILLSVAALVGVATAVPTALEARGVSQCNVGTIQCCAGMYTSSSPFIIALSQASNMSVPSSSGEIGFSCFQILVGGTGIGSSCPQPLVCCTGITYFGGLITSGCFPITVNT